MHDCPSCNRAFETERGRSVHHTTVHDKRLPNRVCSHCESGFVSDYERKYCSETCLDNAVSRAGSNNPNYRGGKTEATCRYCETTFEYYPSEKSGLLCSECVKTAPWRDPPALEGGTNSRWNGGKQSVECTVCTATIDRYPSEIGDVVVCSARCRAKWLSESFAGEGHPNWKGGDTGPYGTGWAAVRRQALERDGHRCINCGETKEDLGRNPDVHHLVPVRVFVEADGFQRTDAHVLDNVVSLCPSCHRRAEFGHISEADLRERAGIDSVPSEIDK